MQFAKNRPIFPCDRKLRITLVVTGYPTPERPGLGIFNLRAARALRSVADINVVHLRMWFPGRRLVSHRMADGINVTTVAVPLMPYLGSHNGIGLAQELSNVLIYRVLAWPLVSKILRNCDLIHSVGADFAGLIASSWAVRARVPHVIQITNSEVERVLPHVNKLRFLRCWERGVQGAACNSRALADAFLSLYPKVRNVRPVWRGVDLDLFHPVGHKEGPQTGRGPVRYLFLGGLPNFRYLPHGTNTKGGETLLAAWKSSEREVARRSASLLIAGPESKSERLNRWRANLQNPDLVDLAGPIRPDQVAAHIRSADAVLIPSMEEGLPNVALEASACGRAVFASNIRGLSEVIVHETTGVLLPAGDVKAWASALVSYADRPTRLTTMGQQARCRMELFFGSTNYPVQMMELYQAALCEPISNGQEVAVPLR
jgi:glycosyltransferase involved in cell wall biosynthesis